MAVADAMTIEEQYTPEGGSATYVTVGGTSLFGLIRVLLILLL